MGLLSTLAQVWTVQRTVRDLGRYRAALNDPRGTQHRWLLNQVRREQGTLFGRDHHFDEIRSVADFRRNVPIGTYEDHAPYIERVRQGETEALFHRQSVRMFALTSGTTSARKYIPVTDRVLENYRRMWTAWGFLAYSRHRAAFPHARLTLVGDWDEFRTPSGIPCGSISGFTARLQNWIVRRGYVLPLAAARLPSLAAKYYLAWRLGLVRTVGSWMTPNPSTLLQLARFGTEHAEALLRDVRDGTLTGPYEWPAELLREVRGRLHPAAARARELEHLLHRTGEWRPRDVWPELQLIGCWTGGSMGAYLRSFPRYFGDIAVRDLGLIASEGRMTFPFEDHTPSGVLEVVSGFFEFIPVGDIESRQPTVLEAHELQEGHEYFILLTTASGLYRYHIRDVVRCTGWHHRTPLLEFLHKGDGVTSITGEKLTEYQATVAMSEALRECGLPVDAFALAPCWQEERPYYRLLLEAAAVPNAAMAQILAEAVDRRLQAGNIEYASKRRSDRLGPLQPMIVPNGFWERWDEQQRQRSGGTAEQFKRRVLLPQLPDGLLETLAERLLAPEACVN